MALRLHGSLLSKEINANKFILNKRNSLLKKIKLFSRNVKFFRQDSESIGIYNSDLDISDELGWFSCFDTKENFELAAKTMIECVYDMESVYTDRLHVGIASILSGTDTYLYDNTYGKISGVYYNSLNNITNAKLIKDTK